MKAVCLLVCLALARLSAGHIFKRQYYPEMNGFIGQVDLIKTTDFWRRTHPQSDQPQDSNEQNVINLPQNERSSEENTQQVQKHNRQRQQSKQQKQYQRWQEQQQKQHQQWQGQQQDERNHDSTSAESRSQEAVINEYAMPVFADVQDFNNRMYQNVMQPAFGDAISWRGVQIAASPTNDVQKEDIEKIYNEAYKTMKHASRESKKTFHQKLEQAAKNVNEDSELNATQLLIKNQYPVETHTIKTEDGYFLTMFRIPPKDQALVQRPVVFLMHGLLGSADDWLLMGPGKALAYMLSDAGYDVWLGNARGSKYSRRHVSKHPAQSDFWQFSIDEIALQDLPVMIDYALQTSNQQKLFYVGYSQGTTALFALTATRPEYNDKIIMMYALSPMAYMSNVRSPLFRMIAPTSPFYERLHEQLGHGEFKPSKEFVYTVGGAMCETEISCRNVCSNVNFVMSGVNVENLDVDLIPVIMAHQPAGASTRQVKQYGQAVASREFTKYDFGAQINKRVYGSRQPPKYDMQKVQTPVALYYSEEDWLAHPKDVERLAKELPNVKDSYKVPEPHFTNMDFQFSKKAPQMVYNRLIDSIQKQVSEQNNVY